MMVRFFGGPRDGGIHSLPDGLKHYAVPVIDIETGVSNMHPEVRYTIHPLGQLAVHAEALGFDHYASV